jgi:hypothetical protein
MTPFLLEVQHDVGQTAEIDFSMCLCPGVLADKVILTVDATEVTVGKEDVPNAMSPHEKRFLAKVFCAG